MAGGEQSLDGYLEEIGVPRNALNKRVTNPHMIARHIRDWESLAGYLGLDQLDQEAISRDNHSIETQRQAMLQRWIERNGSWRATYYRLAQCFWNAGRKNLVDNIVHVEELGYTPMPVQPLPTARVENGRPPPAAVPRNGGGGWRRKVTLLSVAVLLVSAGIVMYNKPDSFLNEVIQRIVSNFHHRGSGQFEKKTSAEFSPVTSTDASPSPSGCHPITIKQLPDLVRDLEEFGNWEMLCFNLGVEESVTNGLKHDQTAPEPVNKKIRCLKSYVDGGDACWEHVVRVIAHDFNNKRVAKMIAERRGVDPSIVNEN